MNVKDKVQKLGQHYKVPQGALSMPEWVKAIRKAAGKGEYYNLDTLHEDVFGNGSPKLIEAKAVEVRDAERAPVRPTTAVPPVTVDGATQRVDVAAPSLVFNLAPASVEIKTGDVGWAHTLHRVGVHAFTFVSGVMAGVLVSRAVLKLAGIG